MKNIAKVVKPSNFSIKRFSNKEIYEVKRTVKYLDVAVQV